MSGWLLVVLLYSLGRIRRWTHAFLISSRGRQNADQGGRVVTRAERSFCAHINSKTAKVRIHVGFDVGALEFLLSTTL